MTNTKAHAYLADLNPFTSMTKEQTDKGTARLINDLVKDIALPTKKKRYPNHIMVIRAAKAKAKKEAEAKEAEASKSR